ncbi:F0F1 ATP synthase subunit A [Ideonella sp. B7]|uniref:F0F1 ATP synthase subunit A n=1 Tax=Ideonella benzenivorans TaxID=2831643 RepID=UPI001CEC7378|nr:F0F1 ATP synthase subunit A [Ideonella benzenivorans]MCA6215146.1 F0F1 ATP synthase subunit A [Ideonella benzenivorans]
MDEGFSLHLGGLALSETLCLSFVVTLGLTAVAWFWGPRQGRPPAIGLEVAWQLMHDAVAEVVAPVHVDRVLPFIGSLWLFIGVSNLLGLVPGLTSPTRDLSVTAALAVIVFFAVHLYGLRAAGWRAYLRHYVQPSPILLPFTVISEITRTLALAIRLFGNMMSLEMAALLVLLVAGLLVPVPLLVLHVIEALVQAYIFGMLALIYVGSALEVSLPDGQPPAGRPSPAAASPSSSSSASESP